MTALHLPERILLIEDNPGDARLIEEMLREYRDPGDPPIDLHHEESLAVGLDRLGSIDEPDIVLLDLRLPDSSGLETLETALESIETVPVIVLTGMPDTELGIEAVSNGAQDYLVKDDVTPEVLARAIRYSIERKRTERELRRRTEELTILNHLTRHDIRNDISLVVGRARELTEHVEPRGQSALNEIVQSSNHVLQLTRTVGDIVESISEEEAGSELRPVLLSRVLETEVEKAQGLYRGVEISLEGDDPGLSEVSVRANDLLSSVVGNLISNAVFYNDKETPEVVVSAEADEDRVTLRVADNGPGVPDRRKDRIFDEGERGPGSSGMGIGLLLVERLVDRYGGEIRIEDNEPVGSVFCVDLARADATDG
jgi:signal transduction histidine kinase